MTRQTYSYTTAQAPDGRFLVIDQHTGAVHSSHETEEDADFTAAEAFSDDYVMIRFEEQS